MKCTRCTAYGLSISILLHSSMALAYFYWSQNSSVDNNTQNKTTKIIELSLSEFTVAKVEDAKPIEHELVKPEPEIITEEESEPVEPIIKEEIKPEPIKKPPMIPHTKPEKLESNKEKVIKKEKAPKKQIVTKKKVLSKPRPKNIIKPKPKPKPKSKPKPKPKKKVVKTKTKPIAKTKSIAKKVSKPVQKTPKLINKTTGSAVDKLIKSSPKSNTKTNTNQSSIINQLKKDYQQTVLQQIEKNKHYPKRARRMHKQGSVTIEFIIDKKGNLLDVQVIKSEGHSSFSKAAIKAVNKSAKFQPIPEKLGLNRWKFRTKLVYKLK